MGQYPSCMKKQQKTLKDDRLGTAYSQETIFYQEEPNPINGHALKDILHRSVGALTFLSRHRIPGSGSGVLISQDTVLTAAHNIFDRKLKAENIGFKFYIGADGEAEQYYEIEAWIYPEEFKTLEPDLRLPFDYAIIKLKQSIKFDKFMPLNQYGLARKNRIVETNSRDPRICYGISTLPGQSGSPVVIGNAIIAIHEGGEIGKDYNVGRIIDQTLFNNITEWGKKLNATPFQLETSKVCPHIEEMLGRMKLKLVLERKDLQNMDLSKYAGLLQLSISGNKIKSIDLSHCLRLKTIDLSWNQLRLLDLAKNINLNHLSLNSNKLQKMDVSASTNLAYLNLSYNKLQEINMSFNTNLNIVSLHSNKLKKMDVSVSTKLTHLYLDSNILQKLTQIDLTKNTKLELLRLQQNRLALIRLWIAEDVEEEAYTGKDKYGFYNFGFSNQESAICRVQMKCDVKRQAMRQKAQRIAEVWRQKYYKKDYNKHICAYSFVVQ